MEIVMEKDNVIRAEEYYTLVGEKNAEGIKNYLDSNVEFKGPLATLKGREAVITATNNFMNMFKSLKIRAKFGAGHQAMLVYDIDIPGIAKDFPGASLLSFREGLIVKIELFYDGSRFVEKSKEVFS
jgi:SnoaL-like domain